MIDTEDQQDGGDTQTVNTYRQYSDPLRKECKGNVSYLPIHDG